MFEHMLLDFLTLMQVNRAATQKFSTVKRADGEHNRLSQTVVSCVLCSINYVENNFSVSNTDANTEVFTSYDAS